VSGSTEIKQNSRRASARLLSGNHRVFQPNHEGPPSIIVIRIFILTFRR